jgi:hypothetical protein
MHTPKQNSIRSLPEYWRWLGTRVRLGLTPDEPRLITAYLETPYSERATFGRGR